MTFVVGQEVHPALSRLYIRITHRTRAPGLLVHLRGEGQGLDPQGAPLSSGPSFPFFFLH